MDRDCFGKDNNTNSGFYGGMDDSMKSSTTAYLLVYEKVVKSDIKLETKTIEQREYLKKVLKFNPFKQQEAPQEEEEFSEEEEKKEDEVET